MTSFIDPKEYAKIKKIIPICCVDVIVEFPYKGFLLIKRAQEPMKEKYWFIGGRLYKNEKLIDCAYRKVQKDIGIDFREIIHTEFEFVKTYETFFEEVHTINCTFYTVISKDISDLITLNKNESSSFIWANVESNKSENKDLDPYIRNVIGDCIYDF